jgi:hypothetical protein
VGLEQGETNGYHWAAGVKGPKDEPLGRICAQISMVEPSQDGVPYVEGHDSTECGRLKQATESVSGTDSFGSGASRVTVLEAVYRPIVRKVTFILATGERRIYRPGVPDIPSRSGRGIPNFRYIVIPFEGEVCIRRITTFDGNGGVLANIGSPRCPAGSGNV